MTNTGEYTKEQIDRAKEDFRVFLFIVWEAINLPEPTEIQYAMANDLQRPPSDRFIIQGFRGVAKSFITCAYAVWSLWRDNQIKVMVVSASKDKADANAIFIKRIIETIPFLTTMLPSKEQRNTQNLFDVGGATPDISPSVKAVGITGQITGTRADLLIADDVEVTNNSATQTQRDRLGELIREFDAILKPKGQIVYLGTPQNEMSIYGELQQRGYKCIIYPVRYPRGHGERDFYGNKLAHYLAIRYDDDPALWEGQPTDPKRFSEEEIVKRELSYGKAGFALQFMLNTNLSDQERYPLKVQDLIVSSLDREESSLTWQWTNERTYRIDELPNVALKNDFFYEPLNRSREVSKYTTSILVIDPSGRGADETAFAILKYLNGYIFVLEVGGLREGYADTTLVHLAKKAKFYGVNEIVVEGNYGDGMFSQLFKPVLNRIHPCSITEVKHYTQKEARIIDTLEPVMMRHKLIFNKSVILDDYRVYEKDNRYSLFYQMTRLSKERGSLAHDDRLDSIAMGVKFFLEIMDRDEQIGQEEHLEEFLAKALDPERGLLYQEDIYGDYGGNYNVLRGSHFDDLH